MKNIYSLEEYKQLVNATDNSYRFGYFMELGKYLYAKYTYPDLSIEEAIEKSITYESTQTQRVNENQTIVQPTPCGTCGGGKIL